MITKTSLHAVLAVAALAELPADRFVGAGEIAQAIGGPRNYLGKLLKTLAQAGLLESQKGKGGGFRLAKPADSIRLADIVKPLEDLERWSGCFLGRPRCSETAPCVVHDRWRAVREAYLRFLEQTTVAELAGKTREPTP